MTLGELKQTEFCDSEKITEETLIGIRKVYHCQY